MDSSVIKTFRVVVDFRALNEVTINEFHPLPLITGILDQLKQCHRFSISDLALRFYQMPLANESREYTVISKIQGHYQFKPLVICLKTSPATFRRLMNNVLSEFIGLKCLECMDDIIIKKEKT